MMNSLAEQLRGVASRNRCDNRADRPPAGRRQPVMRTWLGAWRSGISGDRQGPGSNRLPGTSRSQLEAVLFLAREPLALRKLAQLANLADATEARTLLGELQRRYDDRGSAFRVVHVAGGYQMLSRRRFAPWLRGQIGQESGIRLSVPALETLTVVAYRQPVLRAEVEAIRGVACGELLRQLMDQDLLRIVGRSEELGRPMKYGTTKRFLQVYGLQSLDELPWADQLRRAERFHSSDDRATGCSAA